MHNVQYTYLTNKRTNELTYVRWLNAIIPSGEIVELIFPDHVIANIPYLQEIGAILVCAFFQLLILFRILAHWNDVTLTLHHFCESHRIKKDRWNALNATVCVPCMSLYLFTMHSIECLIYNHILFTSIPTILQESGLSDFPNKWKHVFNAIHQLSVFSWYLFVALFIIIYLVP